MWLTLADISHLPQLIPTTPPATFSSGLPTHDTHWDTSELASKFMYNAAAITTIVKTGRKHRGKETKARAA
jgi:hypothetical protein